MRRISGVIMLALLLVAVACMAADYATVEQQMKTQLGAGFTIKRSEMFVCAGDLRQGDLDAIVAHTVTAGSHALWKQYFTKHPTYPIRVYLFSNERIYRQYADKLFGDTDVSYYGYYKPDERALVMNIGSGTGTLMHEMVHALMEPDFPMAPTWLSEGLASLYEQCRIERGGLVGMMNWRFPVLTDGMKQKTTLPLAQLIATSRAQFLDEHLGVHYAQARYFCQFMQERKVLGDFYRQFRDGYAKDKTGAQALENVFHQPIDEIEKDWLVWISKQKPAE